MSTLSLTFCRVAIRLSLLQHQWYPLLLSEDCKSKATYIWGKYRGSLKNTRIDSCDSQLKCPSICESEVLALGHHYKCSPYKLQLNDKEIGKPVGHQFIGPTECGRDPSACGHRMMVEYWLLLFQGLFGIWHLGWVEKKIDLLFQSHPSCYVHLWSEVTSLQRDWDCEAQWRYKASGYCLKMIAAAPLTVPATLPAPS